MQNQSGGGNYDDILEGLLSALMPRLQSAMDERIESFVNMQQERFAQQQAEEAEKQRQQEYEKLFHTQVQNLETAIQDDPDLKEWYETKAPNLKQENPEQVNGILSLINDTMHYGNDLPTIFKYAIRNPEMFNKYTSAPEGIERNKMVYEMAKAAQQMAVPKANTNPNLPNKQLVPPDNENVDVPSEGPTYLY